MRSSTIVTALSGLAFTYAALPTLHTKGSKFFDSNGKQFFVKGIAYQLVPDDPLVDTEQCTRDANLMKTLGANSIRVYHVDPDANHDGCMAAFDAAGIYLWLDLDTFTTQIEAPRPSWTQSQSDAFARVFDEFQVYDNLAGVLVGNEVITTGNGSVAAPYIKAAARDMKAYRDSKGFRNIPVGYSAADIASLRPMLQEYLSCDNSTEGIDYYALNAYEWCGDSTYTQSGYSFLSDDAARLTIPIFFSETGCNTVPPRTFQDQTAILGPEMNGLWSGAIIYEWIQEQNNYGLISYGPKVDATAVGAPPDGFPRSGTPTPVQPDFSNLQAQWATLNPTGIQEGAYSPTLTPPPCPAATPGVWEVNGAVPPPAVGVVLDRASITGSSQSATPSASASASAQGAASPDREIKGGIMGLGVVMAVAVAWL